MRKTISLLGLILFLASTFANAEPVSSDAVRKIAETHIDAQCQFWTDKPLLATKSFSEGQKYSISEVRLLKSSDNEILAYILDLHPEGYIALSPDTDIRPVIAYSFKGGFSMEDTPENILFYLLKQDMKNRLESLPTLSEELKQENNILWEEYSAEKKSFIQQLSSSEQYGPWLTTEWSQGSPYNKFCPLDPNTSTDTDVRCVTGCGPTAMAQIIYYWQYPSSVSFDDTDKYTSSIDPGDEYGERQIEIDDDYENLDFLSFTELNEKLSDIKYDGDEDEIAVLCFACGIAIETAYSSISSGSATTPKSEVFRSKFKYASAETKWGSDTDFYEVLEKNMKDAQPALLVVYYESVCTSAHYIVADGFKDTGEYHLNFGWGGGSDGWYFLPSGMPNYNGIHRGVLNIHPSEISPFYISGKITQSSGDSSVGEYIILTLSGDASKTAHGDSLGEYTFSGLASGDYTVTPSYYLASDLFDLTFDPSSRSYSSLNDNQTEQNYTFETWISGFDNGSSSSGGGGCFIATAAFGTPMAKEVESLCKFRDQILLRTPAGREFVKFYYAVSPFIADFVRWRPGLKAMVREALKPLLEVSKVVK